MWICIFYKNKLDANPQLILLLKILLHTGCKSPNDTLFKINILKEALLVEKQTISQQKVLDLSFNLAP